MTLGQMERLLEPQFVQLEPNSALLLAAEEHAQDEVEPIIKGVDSSVAALTESARGRLRLAALIGEDADDPRAVATAVSTTLFGSGSAPDDHYTSSDGTATAFFAGSAQADYYDPRNSFMDVVLERRIGIPITLSLVYCEVCERLGMPMVGLNAPSHLLVAPADTALDFVVDPFGGGAILNADAAARYVRSGSNP